MQNVHLLRPRLRVVIRLGMVDTGGAREGAKPNAKSHIPRVSFQGGPKPNRRSHIVRSMINGQINCQIMSDPRCTVLFNNTICESCLKQIKLLSSTKGSTVSNLGVPVWLCFAHFHRRKTIKMTGALRHRKISAGCFFLLHNTTRSKEKACGGIYPIQTTDENLKLQGLH